MLGPLHFHWCLEVLLGLALIGHFVWLSLRPGVLPVWFSVPYPLFLALVLGGGGFAIWHHLIMKRARRQAAGRAVLVCSGGCFVRAGVSDKSGHIWTPPRRQAVFLGFAVSLA